jgi:hypothetical protein
MLIGDVVRIVRCANHFQTGPRKVERPSTRGSPPTNPLRPPAMTKAS